MSVAELKQSANTGQTLEKTLSNPALQAQIARALPKHLTADRLMRVVLTQVRAIPELKRCDHASFLSAVMQCAQLGLEPGGALGHAYIIPYKNNKTQKMIAQLIVGYRGMIDLSRRSGQIISLSARSVHEGDRFSYCYGLNDSLEHTPTTDEPGPLTHVYAVAKLKDGGVQFDVLTRKEIDKIRAGSKSSGSGPWVTNYEEMAKKTVVRRLFKYLPVSIEMQQAISFDEAGEAGLALPDPFTFEGEGEKIDDTEIDESDKALQRMESIQNIGEGAPEKQEPEKPVSPKLSYAQIADRIHNATTVSEANAAGLLIAPHIPDAHQCQELRNLFERRLKEIQKAKINYDH